jgi:uncharacterized membrane protein YiaA
MWWGPLLAIDLFADAPLLAEIGYFFSKLAVVTFGVPMRCLPIWHKMSLASLVGCNRLK